MDQVDTELMNFGDILGEGTVVYNNKIKPIGLAMDEVEQYRLSVESLSDLLILNDF